MSKTVLLNTDFKDDICWMEELAAVQRPKSVFKDQ
jgi:hypothetical protein